MAISKGSDDGRGYLSQVSNSNKRFSAFLGELVQSSDA